MTRVELSEPDKVATIILTAALTSYDPGTEPWRVLHDAADEIRAAMAADGDAAAFSTAPPSPAPLPTRHTSMQEHQ